MVEGVVDTAVSAGERFLYAVFDDSMSWEEKRAYAFDPGQMVADFVTGVVIGEFLDGIMAATQNKLRSIFANNDATMREALESGEDVLDEIKRIDEIEVEFNYNSKFDEAEFARQLADQQKGMNELTVREYLDNRQKYIEQGRAIESNAAQQAAREKAFVDKVDFYETHIFKYSRREGTKAAAMKDQVPDQIKAARSAELLELNRKKQAVYEERLLGTTQEVLIEEKIVRDGEELQIGHTKEYVKIGVKNPNNLINQLVNVEIENQLQILH